MNVARRFGDMRPSDTIPAVTPQEDLAPADGTLLTTLLAVGEAPRSAMEQVLELQGMASAEAGFRLACLGYDGGALMAMLDAVAEGSEVIANAWLCRALSEGYMAGRPQDPESPMSFPIGRSWVKTLPDGLRVDGNFQLYGARMESLPGGLHVSGYLDLQRCGDLKAIPSDLQVGGAIYLSECQALVKLPPGIQVGTDLFLDRCVNLKTLPAHLRVDTINLSRCERLEQFPDDMVVRNDLIVKECPRLCELGSGLHVNHTLDARQCLYLEKLPDDIFPTLTGDLILEGCPGVTSLGGIRSVWNANLMDCQALKTLPDRFQAEGNLSLLRCRRLASLPPGLEVGGTLDLSGCTSLHSLPIGLAVWDGLDLSGCVAWDGQIPPDAIVGGTIITDQDPFPGIPLAVWRERYPGGMLQAIQKDMA